MTALYLNATGIVPSIASLGTTIVTNGTFATDLSGWTSTNWTYSSGHAVHNTGNTSPLSQSITTSLGTVYLITFNTVAVTAGTFVLSINGTTITTHNTVETLDTGTWYGLYTADTTGSVTLAFTPSSSSDVSLGNIIVQPLAALSLPSFVIRSDNGTVYAEARGTSALGNLALGQNAFRSNVNGQENVTLGVDTMKASINGDGCVAIGARALTSNGVGDYNIAVGWEALKSNTSGSLNTAVGQSALQANTSGFYNNALGRGALYSNTGGFSCTAVGVNALYGNTTGNYNIGVGANANLNNSTGQFSTIIGVDAGHYNTVGSCTAVGYQALFGNASGGNTGINDAFGVQALKSINGGSQNVAIGYNALQSMSTGTNNTALGYQAGYLATGLNNTYVGSGAAATQTSGNNNICIGNGSALPSTTGNNQLAIASAFYGDLNNKYFGNVSALKAPLHFTGLQIFANNAAAIAGGLTAGAFYRTGADPDVVCVTH